MASTSKKCKCRTKKTCCCLRTKKKCDCPPVERKPKRFDPRCDPFDAEIIDIEDVIVRLYICDTEVIKVYPNCITMGAIKKDLAKELQIEPERVVICQCGSCTKEDAKLYLACPNDQGGVDLDVKIIDKRSVPEPPRVPKDPSKSRLPDFITVHIPAEDTSDGNAKDIVVEIENKAIEKPFVGGYYDTKTNVEYHDAFTLTGPNFQKYKSLDLATRMVQTREMKLKLSDTPVDQSTQAFGDATKLIHVSAASDFVIIPKKYESYAQKVKRENRLGKIVLIQKNFRRYLLWSNIQRWASEYRAIVADRLEVERKIKERETRIRLYRANAAKNFPRTREDFGLLYAHVKKWKQQELTRINSMYSGAARLAEVNILLDKEIQMLNGIERQHQIVRQAVRDFKEQQLLKKMGEPIKWVGYRDRVVEMDLLRNQRVRFLAELREDLKKNMPKEKRMELLTSIEKILQDEGDFPQILELRDLIDREMNLLCFTKHCDMSILRQRILHIFLDLIKFNKEGIVEKTQNRMCDCCKLVKPISEFALRTRQTTVDTCQVCFNLKTAGGDITVYRAILRSIRRDERKHRSLASYAFILQEDDVRYIVDTIWHRHSYLSKEEDINYLRLPRWIKSEEWSPWNCILLTETEARHHNTLTELRSVYDENMMLEIVNRHLLAKNAFKKLQDVEIDFVESGQWWEGGIKDKVV